MVVDDDTIYNSTLRNNESDAMLVMCDALPNVMLQCIRSVMQAFDLCMTPISLVEIHQTRCRIDGVERFPNLDNQMTRGKAS